MSSIPTTISCARLLRVLDALTEPVFRQVRKVMPPIGGLDLSPIVVLRGDLVPAIQPIQWLSIRFGF